MICRYVVRLFMILLRNLREPPLERYAWVARPRTSGLQQALCNVYTFCEEIAPTCDTQWLLHPSGMQ